MSHGADCTEEQLVLEPDLLRLSVVLDVHVDWHHKAAVAGLRHLVRRLLDYCNAKRNSVSDIKRVIGRLMHCLFTAFNSLLFKPYLIVVSVILSGVERTAV